MRWQPRRARPATRRCACRARTTAPTARAPARSSWPPPQAMPRPWSAGWTCVAKATAGSCPIHSDGHIGRQRASRHEAIRRSRMSNDAIDLLIKRELPAAVRGDRDAYGRIIVASQNAVTAVALAITRDVHTSEDIAQEAFLSAWHHLPRLKNPSSFLPWLRQITRNLAHDHLRGRRNRMLDGEVADLAIQHAAEPDGCPLEQALDAERDAVAADLISELPAESREALLLYYREGQSSKQVAMLLGLSDAAVRKRLSRARQSVRADLLQRFGEFARSSAPSAAFAVGVTATLGIAKPAAAAGLGLATR